jgi:hypothetical protein
MPEMRIRQILGAHRGSLRMTMAAVSTGVEVQRAVCAMPLILENVAQSEAMQP